MRKISEGFSGERAIVTPYYVRKIQAQNPLTAHLYVTHIGYYPQARFHYRERGQGAPENILIYCVEGAGWVNIDGENHSLHSDQTIIIPAGKPHIYGANPFSPWSIFWIHFCGEKAAVYSPPMGKVIDVPDKNSSRFDDRISLFEEIFHNLDMGYSPDNLEYSSVCLLHFMASIRYIPQFNDMNSIKSEDMVQKSIRFMKDNLETKITLEMLAQEAGYSVSRYTALFSQKTSYSPHQYLNILRIQKACNFLQFSDMKIKEISNRLLFYDQYHFSKTFTKTMEISPNEYRRRYKQFVERENESI